MNTSFKANAAQHKAFIAAVKSQFPAINLTGLSFELHSSDYNYYWAINDVITFFTATGKSKTGKYFVVKASDLLVSVDEDSMLNNIVASNILAKQESLQAPARNSIGSLNDTEENLAEWHWRNSVDVVDENGENHYIPPTGYHSAYSSEENQFVHWEKDDSSDEMNGDDWQPTYLDYPSEDIPDDLSIQSQDLVDSPDDACDTSLEDDSDLYWDIESSLEEDNDDDSHLLYADKTVLVSADDTEESFKADWLTNKQHEDALQAAKILFHYWALSGNELPLPNNWGNLCEFVKSVDAKALILDLLWENTHKSQDLFFQTLDNQANNYGVTTWFTQKDINVYQQNYQAIVADCEAIIALHEQAYKNADNGIGEYIAFPVDMVDLHQLVEYLLGTEKANEVVNSIKEEEWLFFQVLSTMNFINSTASIVEA